MTDLGPLTDAVERRLDALERDRVVERIWERDHSVWRDDPTEILDRLGWLTVAEDMRERLPELRSIAEGFAAGGFDRAVLLGMGGSSLAAETIRAVCGVAPGALDLHVLDSTHPAAVARVEAEGDLRRTLFVVASKSGTTTETLCHLQYFYGRIQRGDHFVAITDPGSPLASLAESHGFRGAFLNPPDIGGRYSALSLFGLVPAALIGADVDALLNDAMREAEMCRRPPRSNPGAFLGAALGESARAGRDKATFVFPPSHSAVGAWVEQLVAESTGKDGTGLLPIVDEPPGGAPAGGARRDDRIFTAFGDHPQLKGATALIEAPDIPLGSLFTVLEFGTAVAGHVLGINPFDQPNVAEAKEATAAILKDGIGSLPGFDDPAPLLAGPLSYLGILAYVDPSAQNAARIQRVRTALRDRLGVAVTAGFGPRYLHSTGQLHKGGPDGGAFLMVVDEHRAEDINVPGRGYTFGGLIDAQSLGDLRSLRAHGRAVARIRMQDLEALA